jgi:asparagine synthetase B (glutamine-hydrolysing)
MCSIIFTTKKIEDLDSINMFNKFRGPDLTSVKEVHNHTFVHNLLSITGAFKSQPFEKDNVFAIYNGEIYNSTEFGEYESDGECLIDCYNKFGVTFTKFLDGEFAIVLVDYKKNICIVSADIFKTKPIFFSLDDEGLGVSTYSNSLMKLGHRNIKKCEPNKTIVIDLNTLSIIQEFTIFDFDVKNQHKDNFEDFIKSFEDSIRKRTSKTREKIFIGLSSGYDSGAICNELIKQNVNFKSYILKGTENEEILSERIKILDSKKLDYTILHKNDSRLLDTINYIKKNTEEFKYTISSSSSDYNEFNLSLTDDGGSRHLSYICYTARKEGFKILISGSGPDELYSDYGHNGVKYYNHSNFGGLFPEDLSTIFPWNSFFGSSMESYIAKEEYVGGSYGIEVRYPFLDKELVQEFLWLDTRLKNLVYKSPLDYYLSNNKYPFNKGQKLGF